MPKIFEDDVFEKAFEKAELAKLDNAALDQYENSLKIYRDLKGVIETAFDDGKIEGKLEEKREIARNMKTEGESLDRIIKFTGLSEDEIKLL